MEVLFQSGEKQRCYQKCYKVFIAEVKYEQQFLF